MRGDRLEPLSERWMHDVVRVFEAELICCRLLHTNQAICDREGLVLPLLGLWSRLCAEAGETANPTASSKTTVMRRMIREQRDDVFPPSFLFVSDGPSGAV